LDFVPRTRTGTVVAYNDKVVSCTVATEAPTLSAAGVAIGVGNENTTGICTVPKIVADAFPDPSTGAAAVCNAATSVDSCKALSFTVGATTSIASGTISARDYNLCVWAVPSTVPATCTAAKLVLTTVSDALAYVADFGATEGYGTGSELDTAGVYVTDTGTGMQPEIACQPKCPGHTVGLNPGASDSIGKFLIGEHTVKWTAADSFGNAASCQTKVTVHDCACPKFEYNSTTAPDTSCTDRTKTTNAGKCFATFANLRVSATDNSDIAPKISMYVSQVVDGTTLRRPVDSDYKFPLGVTQINAMAWDMSAWFESTAYPGGAYPGAVGNAFTYPRIAGQVELQSTRCSVAASDAALTTCSYFPVEGTVDSPCTCSFTVTVTDDEAPVACPTGSLADITVLALDDDAVSSGSIGVFAAYGARSLSIPTGFGHASWPTVTDNSGCFDPASTKYYVADQLGCAGGTGGEVVGGYVQQTLAVADGTAEATRFYMGEQVEITAVFSDCSGNPTNCSFFVNVPGQWMKYTTFDAVALACPTCSGGCTAPSVVNFGQTCVTGADAADAGTADGRVQLDTLATADSNTVDTTPGTHLRVVKGPSSSSTLLGHTTFWTSTATADGSDGNDNLGAYNGNTEDYDCDSIGVVSEDPVPTSTHMLAGSTYFSMEDPDGMYEVQLDSIIVPRSTSLKFVSALYRASGTAGNIFFTIVTTDTCGAVATVTEPFDLSTIGGGWNAYEYATPAGVVTVTISLGLNSTSGDAVASFDHVGFGEKGCTDALAANYNENAIIDDGTCTAALLCCMNPLASNYDAGCTLARSAPAGDVNACQGDFVLAGIQGDMQTLKSNENELRGLLTSIQELLA